MIPYYIYIPIPADDKGSNLTGPEFVGLLVGLIIFCVWFIAVFCVSVELALDFDDNKQDRKRHTIELIALIAIGVIALIFL